MLKAATSSFGGGLRAAPSSEIDVLVDMEEAAAAMEVALEQKEKLDLSIFEAENRASLEAAESGGVSKDPKKMKVALELRVQSAIGSVSSQVVEALEDTAVCARQATELCGKDDWKDYKTLKDVVAELQESGKGLEPLLADFKRTVLSLVEEEAEVSSAKKYKECCLQLQEHRSALSKSIGMLKKKVGSIKGSMKSLEKRLFGGVTADADVHTEAASDCVSLAQVVLFYSCKDAWLSLLGLAWLSLLACLACLAQLAWLSLLGLACSACLG